MTATIETEISRRVATIRFNRPDKLNALNSEVMNEVVAAAEAFAADPAVGCLLLCGTGRAFAAGADIEELSRQNYATMYDADFFAGWDRFAATRVPKVAAVQGYALGGGCEVAMMCDVILAADNARFGQPEIKIGCIPGIGGTQRLTRLVGRARAMDMILTGRMVEAEEALAMGLVSRIVPADELDEAAREVAQTIAGYARDISMMARSCVDMADKTSLEAGLRYERQMYHALYGTDAQREGMAAFLEKRPARFNAPDV